MPDDFTRQSGTPGSQWVKIIIINDHFSVHNTDKDPQSPLSRWRWLILTHDLCRKTGDTLYKVHSLPKRLPDDVQKLMLLYSNKITCNYRPTLGTSTDFQTNIQYRRKPKLGDWKKKKHFIIIFQLNSPLSSSQQQVSLFLSWVHETLSGCERNKLLIKIEANKN